MSPGSVVRVVERLEAAAAAAGQASSLLYIYLERPRLPLKPHWIFVKRRAGLEGLAEAIGYGLSFAPELLGYEASIIEVEEPDELALLAALSPSSLGSVYAVYSSDLRRALEGAGLPYTDEGGGIYKVLIQFP